LISKNKKRQTSGMEKKKGTEITITPLIVIVDNIQN
jgi:hypothetical protein